MVIMTIRPTTEELISLYCYNSYLIFCNSDSALDINVRNMIWYMTTREVKAEVLTKLVDTKVFENLTFSDNIHCDTVQCYLVMKQPTAMDWIGAYKEDSVTRELMEIITANKQSMSTRNQDTKKYNHICSCHRKPLRDGNVKFENRQLVVYKRIHHT